MGSSCVLLYIYMYIQWIHINNNATETNVFTFKNSLRLECKYLISLFFFLHSDPPLPYIYFVLFQILGPFSLFLDEVIGDGGVCVYVCVFTNT